VKGYRPTLDLVCEPLAPVLPEPPAEGLIDGLPDVEQRRLAATVDRVPAVDLIEPEVLRTMQRDRS